MDWFPANGQNLFRKNASLLCFLFEAGVEPKIKYCYVCSGAQPLNQSTVEAPQHIP